MSLQVWSSGRLEITWSDIVILPFISGATRVLKREYTSLSRHFISAIAKLQDISNRSSSISSTEARLTVSQYILYHQAQRQGKTNYKLLIDLSAIDLLNVKKKGWSVEGVQREFVRCLKPNFANYKSSNDVDGCTSGRKKQRKPDIRSI